MLDAKLRAWSLWIVAGAGFLSLAGAFDSALVPTLFPATVFVASIAVMLFVRIALSASYRQGLDRVNREMRETNPFPGKMRKFLDREWGLFGTRVGDFYLLRVRAVLVLGIMPLAMAEAWVGKAVVHLWWAAMFVSIELSIMYAIVTTQAPKAE